MSDEELYALFKKNYSKFSDDELREQILLTVNSTNRNSLENILFYMLMNFCFVEEGEINAD